jgi:hypothetical protein
MGYVGGERYWYGQGVRSQENELLTYLQHAHLAPQ